MEHKKPSLNQQLFEEFRALQNVQNERQKAKKKNQTYISKLTSLEFKLSELSVELEAKLWNSKDSDSENKSENSTKFFSQSTESQKDSIKAQVLKQLKAELNRETSLKNLYEEKYKLLSDREEPSQSKQLLNAQRIQELKQERDYLKGEVLPQLEKSLRQHEQEKTQMESEIQSLREQLELLKTRNSETFKSKSLVPKKPKSQPHTNRSVNASPFEHKKRSPLRAPKKSRYLPTHFRQEPTLKK